VWIRNLGDGEVRGRETRLRTVVIPKWTSLFRVTPVGMSDSVESRASPDVRALSLLRGSFSRSEEANVGLEADDIAGNV
jgi:hypothetical protein